MEMPTKIGTTMISGLVFLVITSVTGQSYQDEFALRLKLKANYDPNIRPVLNQSSVLNLQANFHIISIHDLNWKNEMLTWNVSEYGGMDNILVQPNEVWTPDLVVDGSMNFCNVNLNNAFIRLWNTGHIAWYPECFMETQCAVDITRYPFDTQICDITLSLWMYSTNKVNITYNPLTLRNSTSYKPNGEWQLIGITALSETVSDEAHEASYGFLKYRATLQRRVTYHVLNTLLPIWILSILNVLVFVLPPESGEKMSLSITVLLAHTVFLSIINEDMPATSTSVSVLSIYIVLILAVGTTATFLSAIVLHFAHYEEERKRRFFPMGQRDKVSETKRSMLFTKTSDESLENGEALKAPQEYQRNKEVPHKGLVSTDEQKRVRSQLDTVDRIDVLAFWTMTVMIVLLATICFMLMAVGNS